VSKQRSTLSKQGFTLSKGRNFNAKLVRHCCRFGNKVEQLCIAFDNVASTLLLVWTGFKCRYTLPVFTGVVHTRRDEYHFARQRAVNGAVNTVVGGVQATLLEDHTKELRRVIGPGARRLNWNSLGIYDYISKCVAVGRCKIFRAAAACAYDSLVVSNDVDFCYSGNEIAKG